MNNRVLTREQMIKYTPNSAQILKDSSFSPSSFEGADMDDLRK